MDQIIRQERIYRSETIFLSCNTDSNSKIQIDFGEKRMYVYLHDCTKKICLRFEYGDPRGKQKLNNLIESLTNIKIPDNAPDL